MNDKTKNKTTAELKQIIKDEYPNIDIKKITDDTVLGAELGIDSLEMMLLLVKIEEFYHIEIDNFPYVRTFGDILTLIDSIRK